MAFNQNNNDMNDYDADYGHLDVHFPDAKYRKQKNPAHTLRNKCYHFPTIGPTMTGTFSDITPIDGYFYDPRVVNQTVAHSDRWDDLSRHLAAHYVRTFKRYYEHENCVESSYRVPIIGCRKLKKGASAWSKAPGDFEEILYSDDAASQAGDEFVTVKVRYYSKERRVIGGRTYRDSYSRADQDDYLRQLKKATIAYCEYHTCGQFFPEGQR
jgi:hypothetical protein